MVSISTVMLGYSSWKASYILARVSSLPPEALKLQYVMVTGSASAGDSSAGGASEPVSSAGGSEVSAAGAPQADRSIRKASRTDMSDKSFFIFISSSLNFGL